MKNINYVTLKKGAKRFTNPLNAVNLHHSTFLNSRSISSPMSKNNCHTLRYKFLKHNEFIIKKRLNKEIYLALNMVILQQHKFRSSTKTVSVTFSTSHSWQISLICNVLRSLNAATCFSKGRLDSFTRSLCFFMLVSFTASPNMKCWNKFHLNEMK